MTDKAVSALTSLTGANTATGDLLYIVDISEAAAADRSKKITVGDIFVAIPNGTNSAPSIAFASDPDTGIFRAGANSLGIAVGGTQIATVSSGNFEIGTSGSPARLRVLSTTSQSNGIYVTHPVATQDAISCENSDTSGDNKFIVFYSDATVTRGSITYNRGGGLVAYNTSSDYRAKDIIGPVQNPGATIDALKVYEGKMKGATVSRPMLVAHEAQEIAPYAVTGEKDAVNEDGTPKYQQMDVSSLVPLLLAEIQSLRARVAQLEAK